jgi:hypothetical protein
LLSFCTYFDLNYLPKGLALYNSLVRHAGPFQLFVLCLDDRTYTKLREMNLEGLRPISMEEFERDDQELVSTKGNRSRIEYYFTCSPSIPLYILREHPTIETITYLDADLYFFASPAPIYEELGDGSVGIIAHRFPDHLEELTIHGIYNVGLLVFRNDARGLAVLHWWRERCIEWCYDRVEGDRFADQKYLDRWPETFDGVVVLENKGVGLSPWNVDRYRIARRGEQVYVDDDPLVFYHFHGLKQIASSLFDCGLTPYSARMTDGLRREVYAPYLRQLKPLIQRNRMPMGSIRLNAPQRRRRDLWRQLLRKRSMLSIGPIAREVRLSYLSQVLTWLRTIFN